METPRLGALVDHVALLPEPRRDRTKRHLVLDIVVMAVWAGIGGADTWVDLAAYGRAKYAWFKRFLALPHGIPAHETLARVCARLHPDAFRTCLVGGLEGVREQTGGQLGSQCMAVDGKTSRPSFERALGRSPWHLVRAWATATGLVWGQVAVEEKSPELTAIPELWTVLEWAGGMVTIDAMGPQKEMATTMVAQEADDVLALTGNQGTL
jgi:DDE_Tnp_1-associated